MVECIAYTFQVTVNHLIGMEIVEAPRDAEQLTVGCEHRSTHHRKVGELTSLIRSALSLSLK